MFGGGFDPAPYAHSLSKNATQKGLSKERTRRYCRVLIAFAPIRHHL
jgi:hypothetical protein